MKETVANPRTCTSLVETKQCTDWPRLIQLSADSGRNIIRSAAGINEVVTTDVAKDQ